ncbi:MAG: hypothetical protein ACE5NN_00265 [Candidatus Bathyarchaeia archaeon]
MELEKVIAAFVGLLQSLIGALAIASAYLIYYDPDNMKIRTILNILPQNAALYVLLFSMVGSFSVLSGILIIYEWILS